MIQFLIFDEAMRLETKPRVMYIGFLDDMDLNDWLREATGSMKDSGCYRFITGLTIVRTTSPRGFRLV